VSSQGHETAPLTPVLDITANPLAELADSFLDGTAKDDADRRAAVVQCLTDIREQMDSANAIWQSYAENPTQDDDQYTAVMWIGPQQSRDLHRLRLNLRELARQLSEVSGIAFHDTIGISPQTDIVDAYGQLMPDETGASRATSSIETIEKRRADIENTISRLSWRGYTIASATALLLSLFLTARAYSAQPGEDSPSAETADVLVSVNFELPDTDGVLHRLSDARGRWVLVNFWATWCAPCVTEIPIIQKFVRARADSLTAIGINFEEIDRRSLQTAIEELDIRYLVVQAGDAPILPFEPLKGLPSTFLVNPDGGLVFRHTGELSEQQLEDAFKTAVTDYSKAAE